MLNEERVILMTKLASYEDTEGKKNVKIGNWQGSTLVAFAPESLSAEGAYQALTGGVS